ncbi:MAG: hypothetical protein RLN85_05730, partial [Pseudomonadales bacterium]
MTIDLRGRSAFFVFSVFGLTIVVLAAVLAMPFELPIGASFWDTYIYLDGAYRMEQGQQIYRDFHAPVGPLNYVLFGLLHSVFDTANIVLLIQWCMILVTAP